MINLNVANYPDFMPEYCTTRNNYIEAFKC